MEFKDIAAIVGAGIVSAGGIGGIIIAVVKFCSNLIADRLSAKYEDKLQKEMERYKTELSKKEYVSKTRFDVEFAIYRDLSKTFSETVRAITLMIPCGIAYYPADKDAKEKYENNLYDQAIRATVAARDTLNGNIPFIQKTMFEKFNEILSLCNMQLGAFNRRWNKLYFAENKNSFTSEEYERSKEISDKFKALCSEMRTYLSSLDVVE